jgi:nucleoside-diphosphate kinase
MIAQRGVQAHMVEDSFAFTVHWFDKMACIEKPFRLMYYPFDRTVEIIDMKTRKVCLKRIKHEALSQSDLYIGNQVDIYGRRYKIVDYADQYTQDTLI